MTSPPNTTATSHTPLGIDIDGLTRWFLDTVHIDGPLTIRLIAGGHSNLTYEVAEPHGQRWALRRPPMGALRATAHDMDREWTILSALASTDVLIPRPVGYCAEPSVIGAPFYVTQFVDGVVLDSEKAAALLDAPARATFCRSLIHSLARIHAVDITEVGLETLALPEPYVARQLRRWTRQLTGADKRLTAPLIELQRRLADGMPPDGAAGLIHGDFRPGNVMFGRGGEIVAVLDWELSAVGDVRTDLGWLIAWWTSIIDTSWSPQPQTGFWTVEELLAAYEAERGTTIEHIGYYSAFALWRLACICLGVFERYREGRMGELSEPLEKLEARPLQLAKLAADALAH